MADLNTKSILSVCATTANRLPDLAIKNGRLIFVQDRHRIALDFGGKRTFYNQIEELATESERTALENPMSGSFYFVISTAVLWTYQESGWIPLTTSPQEILFIGTELPLLGSENKLFVNTADREISVWNPDTQDYTVVADSHEIVTTSDIDALF